MGRLNSGGPAAVAGRLVTLERLEELYAVEYPKLVKLLVVLGATHEEAEDAAQKAMADLARRLQAAAGPHRNPAAYVRKAAIRYFIKERKRDRERLSREIKGGHLVMEEHPDDGLTAWEEEEHIQHLLQSLTLTQRKVITLVVEGLSTAEIAEELGKSCENIRQQRKNGLDRLRRHPDIAQNKPAGHSPAQQAIRPAAATSAPGKGEVQ